MVRNFLLCLAAVVFSVSATAGAWAWDYTNVDAEQAKNMIDTNSDLIIVDVREYATEYCSPGGHIPCALNYPWNSGVLEDRYRELPKTAEILVL